MLHSSVIIGREVRGMVKEQIAPAKVCVLSKQNNSMKMGISPFVLPCLFVGYFFIFYFFYVFNSFIFLLTITTKKLVLTSMFLTFWVG